MWKDIAVGLCVSIASAMVWVGSLATIVYALDRAGALLARRYGTDGAVAVFTGVAIVVIYLTLQTTQFVNAMHVARQKEEGQS